MLRAATSDSVALQVHWQAIGDPRNLFRPSALCASRFTPLVCRCNQWVWGFWRGVELVGIWRDRQRTIAPPCSLAGDRAGRNHRTFESGACDRFPGNEHQRQRPRFAAGRHYAGECRRWHQMVDVKPRPVPVLRDPNSRTMPNRVSSRFTGLALATILSLSMLEILPTAAMAAGGVGG